MKGNTMRFEWKSEPESPLASTPPYYVTTEELDDEAPYYATTPSPEREYGETKAELASKLLQDLERLEDLDEYIKTDIEDLIKDEPFSNWLEEKMLPMFEEVPVAPAPMMVVQQPLLKTEHRLNDADDAAAVATVPDTQSLLKEFEHVLDAVEFNHFGALTPPRSPTYEASLPASTYRLITLAPVAVVPPSPPSPVPSVEYRPLDGTSEQEMVARELAVVDEIVRTRAEDLIRCSSPGDNSCSGSSNFGDCSSSSSDDPEWIPETIDRLSRSSSPIAEPIRKQRSKPYSRSSNEDKKSRKKEQNKNAATRYRMKKKAEVEEILEEERSVADDNTKLESRICDLRREIRYLKSLMRELFKAKGLIV